MIVDFPNFLTSLAPDVLEWLPRWGGGWEGGVGHTSGPHKNKKKWLDIQMYSC